MFKVINALDWVVDKCIDIVLILILLLGMYFAYDSYYVFSRVDLADIKAYRPTVNNQETLKELSKDAVAWLTIDNTSIDYPIMQGKTNVEYLNKDPYGDYSLSGSIFLDSRCNRYFEDNYALVYGHHMENGYMFGAIEKWQDEYYFNNYRKGKLITTNGNEYNVDIFGYGEIDASDELIFNVDSDGDRFEFAKDHSTYYEIPSIQEDEKMMVLSTCASPKTTKRKVLYCTLTTSKGKGDRNGNIKENQ